MFKDWEEMADIIVGPEKTRFHVHRDLAAHQSPFFAAALRGNFVEGRTGEVLLPDIEPKIFEHVILWMYQSKLDQAPQTFFKDSKPTYFTLLDIYAVADQLCIEGLRNAVVDLMAELADQTNSVPTPMDTNLLYENIRENAPIRHLVLDLFAYKKTDNLLSTHPDPWLPTFLRELTCNLKRHGQTALVRHEIRPFKARGGSESKACEICKTMVGLHGGVSVKCSNCQRVFCAECVYRVLNEQAGGVIDWSIAERECKPWSSIRGRCQYHEHTETETCKFESLDAMLGHGAGHGGARR